jgi:hypothetical protein
MKIASFLTLTALGALSASFVEGAEDKNSNKNIRRDSHRDLAEMHGSREPAAVRNPPLNTNKNKAAIQSKLESSSGAQVQSARHHAAQVRSERKHEIASAVSDPKPEGAVACPPEESKPTCISGYTLVNLHFWSDPDSDPDNHFYMNDGSTDIWDFEAVASNCEYNIYNCLDQDYCYTFSIFDDAQDGFRGGSFLDFYIENREELSIRDGEEFYEQSLDFGNC